MVRFQALPGPPWFPYTLPLPRAQRGLRSGAQRRCTPPAAGAPPQCSFRGWDFPGKKRPLPSVAVAPRLFASAAACAPKGLRGANPR